MKRKRIAVLMSLLFAFTLFGGTAWAAGEDTVADASSIWIKPDVTSQEDIDSAWGEGAASFVQNADGSYTLTLLKNISLGEYRTLSLGTQFGGAEDPLIILDLNGFAITGTSIPLANYANLTIRDSSAEKTGAVVYAGGQYMVALNNVGNKLTIEGGTFTCNGAGSATYNAAVSTSADATTIINGGTFEGGAAGAISSYGDTVINGGTIEGKYGVVAKVNSEGVKGNITFPENSTAVVNATSMAFVVSGSQEGSGTIHAAGGTFNAPAIVGTLGSGVDKAAATDITGGVFTVDPTDYTGESAVAGFTPAGEDTTYAVGSKRIAEEAAAAKEGDAIHILAGNISLSNIAGGVTVKNEGTGQVSVNGESIAANGEIITHKHRAEKVEEKAPTATENGNIAYWYCPDCGKYFSDAALTREIAKADTVLRATGETQTPSEEKPIPSTDIPKTGDSVPILGYLLALLGAGTICFGVLIRKRKTMQ